MNAAGMQDPVGEDVTTLTVTSKLHLVDGDEVETLWQSGSVTDGHAGTNRHRFHRAAQIARARRQDSLLAGDQPDFRRAEPCHQPVVILACQKAQRKADQARVIAGHPLHREMRLAGIGRAENNRDPALVGAAGIMTRIGLRPVWRKGRPVWCSG